MSHCPQTPSPHITAEKCWLHRLSRSDSSFTPHNPERIPKLPFSFSFKQNNFTTPPHSERSLTQPQNIKLSPKERPLSGFPREKHDLSSERKALFKKPVFFIIHRKQRGKQLFLLFPQLFPCCIIISAVGVSACGDAWTSQGNVCNSHHLIKKNSNDCCVKPQIWWRKIVKTVLQLTI